MIVRTPFGALQGVVEHEIVAFRGVPYAAPPVGPRRFAPPTPPTPWSNVRDASCNGAIAPQARSRLSAAMGDFSAPQHEDCLTLTIWTPAPDTARRPVLVWLHGGAWSSGAGSLAWYDGGRLAREADIVVVGVNYRLGALGYLHAPGISPGNLGTLDQIAALRWVHDTIASFGGDPDCVTLAGQSAGAASIGRIALIADARALFHRAIMQSGGFGRPPLTHDQAATIGVDFVRRLGIDPDATAAVTQLRDIPVAQLLEAQAALARSRSKFADTTPPFMPVVADAVDEATLIGKIGDAASDLDVMIGTTHDEVHAFFAANPAMTDPPADAVAATFAELAGSADGITRYRRRRPAGTTMDLLADLGTDTTFARPSTRLADALAARGGTVYAYRFDWHPPRSRFKACHCIELPFVFGTLDAWPDAAMLAGGDRDEMASLSAILRDHWGRFVRDGAPAPDWPRYDAQRRLTMLFAETNQPVGDPIGLGMTS